MLLMGPVTIMPLPGAGAVAPKGDSNFWDRPRPWPVPNTLSLRCVIFALSNVAMGLSGKTAITLASDERKELAFRPTQNAHAQSKKGNSSRPFSGWSQQKPQMQSNGARTSR